MTMKFYICIALMTLSSCAGPSKDRLRDLLAECRRENRQRVSIIKMYREQKCATHPEQDYGTVGYDEAGH